MKGTALITGASGGLGAEFARILAEEGFTLILTARHADKLDALKRELEDSFGSSVTIIPADLTQNGAVASLYAEIIAAGLTVDVLINNAGFGDYSAFLDADWDKQRRMVSLNITALMELSYRFGRDMRKRGYGRILNIASAAAFSPGPYMSVYYASKAFVLSFSQALSLELEQTGVKVTALCLGPTSTGFESAASMEHSTMFRKIKPAEPWDVARTGYRAMRKGVAVRYHGFPTKLISFGTRLCPRAITCRLARSINGIPHETHGRTRR